jgi:hypothetical protein
MSAGAARLNMPLDYVVTRASPRRFVTKGRRKRKSPGLTNRGFSLMCNPTLRAAHRIERIPPLIRSTAAGLALPRCVAAVIMKNGVGRGALRTISLEGKPHQPARKNRAPRRCAVTSRWVCPRRHHLHCRHPRAPAVEKTITDRCDK